MFALFIPAGAGHEFFNGAEGMFVMVQDGVDLRGDGHLNLMA